VENTYTYTARNADRPEQVVTFTFRNGHLMVDAGAPVEHVHRTAGSRAAIGPLLKPLAVSIVEHAMHPFHVGDVHANVRGGRLTVTAWARAGGLRLAPVTFRIGQVDNPEAAYAFVRQLALRQDASHSPRRFPGPLDYWAAWLAAASAVLIAAALLLGSRRRQAAD